MYTGWFLIGSMAVWRVTHLLSKEDGPFDLVFQIRKKAGAGFFGSLLRLLLPSQYLDSNSIRYFVGQW